MKRHQQDLMGIYLLLVNAFISLPGAAFSPFMSAFYSSHGIHGSQIGILFSIGPFAAICIQPFWAMLSDSTGKRKQVLLVIALGCSLAPLLYYSGNTFVSFFIATMVFTAFSTALGPLSDAIIIQNAYRYHLDFAKIRMGGTIGYALVVFFAGYILKIYPNIQFAMGSVFYFILIFFLLKLPEVPVRKSETKAEPEEVKSKGIFKSRKILLVLSFALISQIGLSFHGSFLGVYLLENGYTQGTIGILSGIATFSEIPILLCINKLIRKFGSLKILACSCSLVALRLLLVTGGGLAPIVVAQLLQSITFMTIYYSCAIYINEHVFPGRHSRGQSMLAMLQAGVGSILGNIVGGMFVDAVGIKSTYRILSAFIFFSSIMVALIYKYIMNKKARQSLPAL